VNELYRETSQVPLIIAGAGGLGREVAWLVEAINASENRSVFDLRGFLAPVGSAAVVAGYPVLGDEAWAQQQLDRTVRFVVAVGAARLRHRIARELETSGFQGATLVHPLAEVGPRCRLGAGVIVAARSTLTVDITVDPHVLINLHCTIGHDVRLGRASSLSPGVHLSGAATLGQEVEVGTGAVVLPGLQLGNHSRLGAGAVLTRPLPAGETWIGIPARGQ
jgi:sugar O-acyltransferase (sialic acid O-acetyltransferase NeuD family)